MNPRTLVDKLGRVKADMAELKGREDRLKTELIECGLGAVEGKLFRCSISHSQVRRIDYKGVVEKLAPPERVLLKFTSTQERVSVRVSARNGK